MSTVSDTDLVTSRGFSKAEDSARHEVSNTLYKKSPSGLLEQFSVGFINSCNAYRVYRSIVCVNHAQNEENFKALLP